MNAEELLVLIRGGIITKDEARRIIERNNDVVLDVPPQAAPKIVTIPCGLPHYPQAPYQVYPYVWPYGITWCSTATTSV